MRLAILSKRLEDALAQALVKRLIMFSTEKQVAEIHKGAQLGITLISEEQFLDITRVVKSN